MWITKKIRTLILTLMIDIDKSLIDEAKRFALKRVEIASEARKVIDNIIKRYAGKYDPESPFNEVLKSECVNDVMLVIREYAAMAGVYLDDIDNGVDAYINETHSGLTYEQRVEEYVSRLFFDFANLYLAYKALGFIVKPGVDFVKENLQGAYAVEGPIQKAINNGADITIPKYGYGISKDAYTQILNSVENMVNSSWGYAQYDYAMRKGARSYVYYRGSSYPCQLCQEQTGYHRIEDEYFSFPPMHAHCVCFVVYIY